MMSESFSHSSVASCSAVTTSAEVCTGGVGRNGGGQLQGPSGLVVVGHDHRPARGGPLKREIVVIVRRVDVGRDRDFAPSAFVPGLERNAVLFEVVLVLFHLDRHLGAGPVDLEMDGDRSTRVVASLADEPQREDELGRVTRLLASHVGHADRQVPLRRFRIGEQMEPDPLPQAEERFAEGRPASAFGIPIVPPNVGANPDVGSARFVGANVIAGRFEQGGEIRGGTRPLGNRRREQRVGRVDFAGLLGRALDQHPVGRTDRFESFGQLSPAGHQFRVAARRALLLHAGRTVEQNDRRVGPASRGQSQPAARQRAADRKDQRGDRRHAERHDQPLPEPRVTARHAVGRQQEHHRAPANRLETPLVDEVNDDRQGDQRKPEQQPRLQEAHRASLPWVRPMRNRMSTRS